MNRWHRPCTLQEGDALMGLHQVEATEHECGLDLHSLLDVGTELEDQTSWGRLSLNGWQTLCEMFALHHPDRFARVVQKWQAYKEMTHAPRTP